MKRRWLDILMVTVLVIGIGVLAYPFVNESLNDFLDQQIISYYQKKANQKNAAETKKAAEMAAKNAEYAKTGTNPGVEAFNEAVGEESLPSKPQQDYFEKHILAVIYIPKIAVSLPVFDQTNDVFLQKGAALLEGTSYPVGGAGTHAVISAHRGLPEAKLFTDLPKLKIGDEFYLDINGQRNAYKVEATQVIEPTDTEPLMIQDGRDLVTLLTCTPYMVNSHRLLVTGARVPYAAKNDRAIQQTNQKNRWGIILWITGSLLALGVLTALLRHFIAGSLLKKQSRDLAFQVLAKDTLKPQAGLTYRLKTKNGKQSVYRNGHPLEETSNQEGIVFFEKVKGGRYQIQNLENEHPVFFVELKTPQAEDFSFEFPDWPQNQYPVNEIQQIVI